MEIAKHLQDMAPSYIREILSDATAPGVVSLAGGLPAPESFPMHLMADTMAGLAHKPELFQYGETAGYAPLLDYIREQYALGESQESIICTGSQQALDLIARTFLQKGDTVALEEPAYLGALQVFGMSQASIETVPQTPNGPNLESLERLFATKRIKMFYAVPDFHNPTGVCWSLSVRLKVAELCQRYSITLIEDAPYRALRFSGSELPMVSSFCPEHSLVLRSFSKIAAPGIRIGSCSGPRKWIEQLVKVKQAADLHSSLPMQSVLLDLLSHDGFPEHLRELCDLYKRRYEFLGSALKQHMPTCSYQPIEGGMFVWLNLPFGNVMDLAKSALQNGVAIVPGDVFYTSAKGNSPALRLNFSHTPEKDFDLAMERLGGIFNEI